MSGETGKIGLVLLIVAIVGGGLIIALVAPAIVNAKPTYGEPLNLAAPLIMAMVGSILIISYFYFRAGGEE